MHTYVSRLAALPAAEVLAGGPLAGEMGPEPDRDCWDWVEPAGEPTGEGEGPLLWLGRWGEAWGENGDCPWLLPPACSPWLLLLLLLDEPPALTAEPRPASVPVGRSSIEPDRSWNRRKGLQLVFMKLNQAFDEKWQAAGGNFKHEHEQIQHYIYFRIHETLYVYCKAEGLYKSLLKNNIKIETHD